tara:strand:+ start:26 stop:322 length:297 start_codon:yes stop_codon:yes gene_type:complete
MAVQIFKDGESIFVKPSSLRAHLDIGWSVDDPNAPVPPPLEIHYPPEMQGIEDDPDAESIILDKMGIDIVHPTPTKPVKKKAAKKKVAKKKTAQKKVG